MITTVILTLRILILFRRERKSNNKLQRKPYLLDVSLINIFFGIFPVRVHSYLILSFFFLYIQRDIGLKSIYIQQMKSVKSIYWIFYQSITYFWYIRSRTYLDCTIILASSPTYWYRMKKTVSRCRECDGIHRICCFYYRRCWE